MSRAAFTQADVARAIKGAIKGAKAGGMGFSRIEFDPKTCRVVVVAGKPEQILADEKNDWDNA